MNMTLKEHGHTFTLGSELGFDEQSVMSALYVCRDCGVLRRRYGDNSPCKGKVRVELREEK
jgi:hypothetical protein